MKSMRIFGLTALAAMCAMAAAQTAPVTLKMTPKAGDTLKFKLTAEMELMGTSATVTGTVTDKVVEVTAEGDYTVESSSTSMTGNFGGQEMPIPDSKSTSKFKASGVIVDIQGEEVSGNAGDAWRRANLANFIYPTNPIKVGDTWTSSVAADSKTGAVASTTNYTVDSFEKIGSHHTVKIKFTSKETEGDAPASSDGFVWLDVKDGTQVKVQVAWNNVPMMGNPISGKVTMERID